MDDDIRKMNTIEGFFPMQQITDQNFDSSYKKKDNNDSDNNMLTENECIQNYVPQYESVGNVCSPTATFKNEFNTQGLNYPEGFNSPVIGSPLE